MEGKMEINVLVREEEMDEGKVFVVNNEELGVSDFGGSIEEAINNFKKSVKDYLEVYPEKKELVIKMEHKPLLMSKVFL